MTGFEERGVDRQYDAANQREARRFFQHSCLICCERGFRINCDRCAIAEANRVAENYFVQRDKQEVFA